MNAIIHKQLEENVMVNMSYCRFHNTNLALRECLEALSERDSLSKEELTACKRLFKIFIEFCCNEGIIIDDDGELNDRLEDFFVSIG